MFALTTVTYALDGAMGEAESSMAKAMKVFNAGLMGVAQASMVGTLGTTKGPAMMESGLNRMGRRKGFGSNLRGAAGVGMGAGLAMLGPAFAALAISVPVFMALKENTEFLDNSFDKLNKRAEKTSKVLDTLSNAAEATKNAEATRLEIFKLSNSAEAKTFSGKLKDINLNAKYSKQITEVSKSATFLSKHLNKSAADIELMTSGTREGMLALEKAQLEYAQKLQGIQLAKDLTDFRERDNKKALSSYMEDPKLDPNELTFLDKIPYLSLFGLLPGIPTGRGSLSEQFDRKRQVIGETLGTRDRTDLTSNVSDLQLKGGQITAARGLATTPTQSTIAMNALTGKGGKPLTTADLPDIQKTLLRALESGDANQEAVALKLTPTIVSALQKKEFGQQEVVDQLNAVAALLKKYRKQVEERNGKTQFDIDLTNKIASERAAILNSINRSRKISEYDAKSAAEGSKITDAKRQYEQQILQSTKMLTADAIINQSNQRKYYATQDEFNAKIEAANQKALEARQDLAIKTLTGSDAGTTFTSLQQDSKTFEKDRDEFYKKLEKEGLKDLAKRMRDSRTASDAGGGEGVANAEDARNITLQYLKETEAPIKTFLALLKLGIIPAGKGMEEKLKEIDTGLGDQVKSIEQSRSNAHTLAREEMKLLQIREGTLEGNQILLKRIKENSDFAFDIGQTMNNENDTITSRNEISLRTLRAEIENLKTKEGMKKAVDASYTSQMTRLSLDRKQLIIDAEIVNNKAKLSALVKEEVDTEEEKAIIARTKAAETFRNKYGRNFFGKEAQRGRASNTEQMIGQQQATSQLMKDYASEGNAIKFHEETLKYAEAQKELNIEQNKGTLFADSMAVKIAEANAEMARFGETMANTTFDAVQNGFKGFVSDMLSGTKNLGDAALGFVNSIVSKMHEELLNRAATQITTGIFESIGMGPDNMNRQGGGIVSRYSTGGSVGRVPAMLTNGEYVVRKKIVDRLGVNELNKINQTGSLEDLYNKPNENGFEMMNSGGMAMPPIIKLKEGGSIQNYLAKRDKTSDSGSQNERSVIDGEIVNTLSNTIAKFVGGLMKMRTGGFVDGLKNSLRSDPSDSAGMKIAKGSGYSSGTILGGYEGYNPEEYSGKIPVRANPLNTRSMLNINRSGPLMSARFRSQDGFSREYGDYLLDKYEHDVDQRNQRMESRAGVSQNLINTVGFMGTSYGARQAVNTAFGNSTNINSNQSSIAGGQNYLYSNDQSSKNYNIEHRSDGGRVQGPAGIDKVGPVLLDRGEFVVKASSVNKVEKQYPGFFDRLNSMKFNEGGVVDPSSSNISQTSETTNNQANSSNVTVNINVSSDGGTTVQGGGASDQAFAAKIKEAVVNVISQEKRVGGMLR